MKPKYKITIPKYEEGKGSFMEGIKLSSNESPFSPDTKAIKYTLKAIKNANRYPPKNPQNLKILIANKFSLKPNNIVLGNGSDEIMQLIFNAFICKDEEVIIPEKTFQMYKILADINSVKTKIIPMQPNYQIDLKKILKSITKKTKAIFIASPNNPTGIQLNYNEILNFVKKLPSRVLCVLDFAYIDFSENNYEKKSKNIIKTGRKNVIILRTFSKSFGMAGLRLGYAISDIETISCIEGFRQPFNINSAAIAMAEYYLENNYVIQKRINKMKKLKKQLETEIKKLKIDILPSQANFLCIKIKNPKKFFQYCINNNVYVRYLESFGMKDFIRVSVSNKKENSIFLNLLKKYQKKSR